MTRWLVTGASGFIGSCLLTDLHRNPPDAFEVAAPARRELELTDPAAVASWLAGHDVAGIVHLAASLEKSPTGAGREVQLRDTFEAGRVVIDEAVAAGVRRVIMAGTLEELGDHEGVLDLGRSVRPRSLYGLCKTLLREWAEYAARRSDLRVDWFRPFVVYGPGQRGDMLMPSAFRAACAGEICDFTDGLQERDFLYVDDLVRWLRGMMRQDGLSSGFHLHHLGTGHPVRVRDVLAMINDEFPSAAFRIGAKARREGEPMVQAAPASSTTDSFAPSWSASIPLREGIRRTADWWRQQGISS